MLSELMFIPIALGNFCIFVTYTLPVAFFPELAISRGFGEGMIGLIFSFLPFGGLLISFLVGSYGAFIKRSFLIALFSSLQSGSLIAFAFLEDIESPNLFLGVAIASRLTQGFALGGLATIIYGYVPTFYPEDVQRKISILEFICGISMTIGVNIGQWLNNLGGYQLPFYSISSVSFIAFMILLFFLPGGKIPAHEHSPLKKRILFKNVSFVFIILAIVSTQAAKAFVSTTLSIHLQAFNQGKELLGVAFLLLTTSFALTNLIFVFFRVAFTRRFLILFGLFSQAISMIFIPPEPLIFQSNNIWILMTGLGLLGGLSNLCFQPTMPELIDIGITISEHDPLLINDFVSGAFTSGNLIAEAIGPLIGGYLFQYFGMRIASLAFLGFYLFVFLGYSILGESYTVTERKTSQLAYMLLEAPITHNI